MTNRYSLSDHIVTIEFPAELESAGVKVTSIKIGGPGEDGKGSFMGEVSVSRNNSVWSTDGDPTGSWVHNRSLDRTGSCDIQLNQISDNVIKLIMLSNIFETTTTSKGCDITVSAVRGGEVVDLEVCTDCYPVKVPDQNYAEKAGMQNWSFTCGRVDFKQTTNF